MGWIETKHKPCPLQEPMWLLQKVKTGEFHVFGMQVSEGVYLNKEGEVIEGNIIAWSRRWRASSPPSDKDLCLKCRTKEGVEIYRYGRHQKCSTCGGAKYDYKIYTETGELIKKHHSLKVLAWQETTY